MAMQFFTHHHAAPAPLQTQQDVASSAFAFKNKIKAASVKLLWEKLSHYIVDALKQQKGVLLPNLGNFRVGPVVGEVKKKIRPIFALLEGGQQLAQHR